MAAAAQPGQPILVLCFNRTLADRISFVLQQRGVDERVQVRTFHAWCQDLVRTYQLAVPVGLKGQVYFAALAEGGRPGDVAVLCRTRALMRPIEAVLRRRGVAHQSMNEDGFRHVDWQASSVKLLTLHSAKGLEFTLVCVAGLQAMPLAEESLDDAVRLLYVAMTRATHQLVLSAHGDSALVQRVREALAAWPREFSALSAP